MSEGLFDEHKKHYSSPFASINPVSENLKMLEQKKAFDIKIEKENGKELSVPVTFGSLFTLPQQEIEHNSFKNGRWGPPEVKWAGVNFSDLTGIIIEGTHVRFVELNGLDYGMVMEIHNAVHANLIIAYSQENQPIPIGRGGPTAAVMRVGATQKAIAHLQSIKFTRDLSQKAEEDMVVKIDSEKIKKEITLWKVKQAVHSMLRKRVSSARSEIAKSQPRRSAKAVKYSKLK